MSDGTGKIIDFHGVKCIATRELLIPFTGISFIELKGAYVRVRTNNKYYFEIMLDDESIEAVKEQPFY